MHSPPGPPAAGRAEARASAPPSHPLIVLVAIDGVRHQDVFEGTNPRWLGGATALGAAELVPELTRLAARGTVLGAPGTRGFYHSGPNYVSLPGYMEMLSGSRSTGCTENDCRAVPRATLLDEFHAETDDPTRAAVFASWPRLERAAAGARGSGVVSTGPEGGYNHELLARYPTSSHWLEVGTSEHAWGGLRRDETTHRLARAYLKEAAPDFLFVSLGETDEHAHAGDYRGYLAALRAADRYVGELARDLEALERAGRPTALFVTADHGRADHFIDHGRDYPESARSFLIAAGGLVRAAGQLDIERAGLCDLAPTIRAMSGLPARTTPDQGRVLHELLSTRE
ncbi:MAG TPA: alkaline phosphatase family protein [Polyangiaceae bacterium]|nr:alkaline phosphatase family protein [Polyangiaceae bacterium]